LSGRCVRVLGADKMLRYKQLQPQKQTAIQARYFQDVPNEKRSRASLRISSRI
jgi:hypothetical protein